MNFKNFLLEFPIDLSVVNDPFEDPEFKQALKNKKILVYHGTSSYYFWDIVQNGLKYSQNRKNWTSTTPGNYFAFTIDRAGMYTMSAVNKVGGVPIIFVLEIPMSFLEQDADDKEGWDKSTNLQTMIVHDVPPKYITGVIYRPDENKIEIPVKKFIEKVNKGKILDIKPENRQVNKFQKATLDDIEHQVLDYLHDLINYTSFEEYLYGNDGFIFNQKVIQELQKPEYKWQNIFQWNGENWIVFLEKLLGKKNTEDYYKTQKQFILPMYRFIKPNISDFKRFRLGIKPKI